MSKAVVLLSGGLDSATCLAIAQAEGHECVPISFDYGQRAHSELAAARRVCDSLGVIPPRVIPLDLGSLGGSALTDNTLSIPEEQGPEGEIPVTYVPARNTVFLSWALALAEVSEAQHIYIGVNALDYSGYPDCRPDFIEAFERVANLATRAGVQGQSLRIEAPLQQSSKAEIIRWGTELGLDYSLTVSCYQADEDGNACGRCDSCRLRRRGFEEAGMADMTRYRSV
ncbi:MAG: 7-cyano-7-deazaguanine synthase QueC [Pseudohongiellaceae bacterium]